MKYFQNMTDAQITTVAKWLEHQGHVPEDNDGNEIKTDRDFIQAFGPDTYVRTLYENSEWLVFVSVDSGIEVVNAVYKPDFEKSESIELAHHATIE